MAGKNIFQGQQELDRLAAQSRLMEPWEGPIYQRVLTGEGLQVLDVGCNDGSKTAARFRRENVVRVLGLEQDPHLVQQAQAAWGGGAFAFCACDVEGEDFPRTLADAMAREGIHRFDVIHLSLVLMHLKDQARLLSRLKDFLAPGGCLLILEPDDRVTAVTPDQQGLFRDFQAIHAADPLSGDRTCVQWLPQALAAAGYRNIRSETGLFRAVGGETQQKQAIFDVHCSYLPEDVQLLRQWEPDNGTYRAWEVWMETQFDRLLAHVLSPDTEITMGVAAITCQGGAP